MHANGNDEHARTARACCDAAVSGLDQTDLARPFVRRTPTCDTGTICMPLVPHCVSPMVFVVKAVLLHLGLVCVGEPRSRASTLGV